MRVLIIEDETKIAAFLKRGLAAEGFAVDVAADGHRALQALDAGGFDLVILDLVLPGVPGEEILRRIRKEGTAVPVIVLTAKDAISDRVANLEAGADDYLVKPFSFSELLARIHARLRLPQDQGWKLSAGGIALDLRRREARVDGRLVELTARELTLLETLMRHGGQTLSQAQLLDQVWGYHHDPGSNVVEVSIRRLRRKIGFDAIETRRGIGYRFRGGKK